jgi:hypothetical protein
MPTLDLYHLYLYPNTVWCPMNNFTRLKAGYYTLFRTHRKEANGNITTVIADIQYALLKPFPGYGRRLGQMRLQIRPVQPVKALCLLTPIQVLHSKIMQRNPNFFSQLQSVNKSFQDFVNDMKNTMQNEYSVQPCPKGNSGWHVQNIFLHNRLNRKWFSSQKDAMDHFQQLFNYRLDHLDKLNPVKWLKRKKII